MLCAAQASAPLPTVSHVCPLRGFQRADVVAPSTSTARYAASLSTLMAATKIEDHVADGDGWVARLPTFFSALGARWKKAARRLAAPLGFDVASIERHTATQGPREATPGRDFRFYSEPTELAAARWIFAEAYGGIRRLFSRLELRRPELARRLLIDELAGVGRRTLGAAAVPDAALAEVP